MDILISEKKLEGYLFNHLKGTKPIHRFKEWLEPPMDGCVIRQLRIGSYGIADIVTIANSDTEHPDITIYELKQGEVGASALLQALRYKAGIFYFLESHGITAHLDQIKCVLIGSRVSDLEDFHLSVAVLRSVSIYAYDICPNSGLSLEIQNWRRANPDYGTKMQKLFIGTDYTQADIEAEYIKAHGQRPL